MGGRVEKSFPPGKAAQRRGREAVMPDPSPVPGLRDSDLRHCRLIRLDVTKQRCRSEVLHHQTAGAGSGARSAGLPAPVHVKIVP